MNKVLTRFSLCIVLQSFLLSLLHASNGMHRFSADQPLYYVIPLAYLTGVMVSFTPCMYPMIPITVSLLHAHVHKSIMHNFTIALCYVLGMATVYATLGYIVATTSLIFGQWFSHPLFLVLMALFFIYFTGAMFGWYEIYIPQFLRSRDNTMQKGSYISSYLLGALAGTVTSPCLTPALALVLGYVAKVGNPITGFLTLFAFSLGLGSLLILVGTWSGILMLLPRSGKWLIETKKIFGFLLLAVCIYIMQPLLLDHTMYLLYGILCAAASVHYLFQALSPYQSSHQ